MRCIDFLFPPKLGEAEIRVLIPDRGKVVKAKFIWKTFKLTRKNDFAEVKIPGLDGAPVQFVSGQSRMLSTVFLFDGSKTKTDVRELMKDVSDLMNVDLEIHAPPILLFQWKGFSFKCVLEAMTEEFILLFPDGRPSLGKMHVSFKEGCTLNQITEERRNGL